MEQIPKEVIKIFAKEGGKIIPHDDSFNLYIEWIKWLDYESVEEKEQIDKLQKKKNKTSEEYRKVGNYYYFKRMSELFKKYGNKNMNIDEYEEVLIFMKQRSLEEYMNSKLTDDEIEFANEQIDSYSKKSNDELYKKVFKERNEDNYKNLSMVDAYVLHYLDKIVQARFLVDFQNEVRKSSEKNAYMSHRSLVYASKQNKNN